VVLLTNTDEEGAGIFAERLRCILEQTPYAAENAHADSFTAPQASASRGSATLVAARRSNAQSRRGIISSQENRTQSRVIYKPEYEAN